jgi:ribosomal protein L37AE/L43A
MKDALMKAGFKTAKTAKSENVREPTRGREVKKSEVHQGERNFCEACQLHQPDVERYKHRNPHTDAEWICSACADKLEIHDQCRTTQQSEFARSKRFRREYGPTFDLNSKAGHKAGPGKPPNRSGNR